MPVDRSHLQIDTTPRRQKFNRFAAHRIQQRTSQSTVAVDTATCGVADATDYLRTGKSPIVKILVIHSAINLDTKFSICSSLHCTFRFGLKNICSRHFGCSNYFRSFGILEDADTTFVDRLIGHLIDACTPNELVLREHSLRLNRVA